MTSQPKYSIIVCCYFEEKSIEEFLTRLILPLREAKISFEVIVTNDGSTDGTYKVLKRMFDQFNEITVVSDLFKNSGQLAAMSCGVTNATGEHFVFIDSDLQLDPEQLTMLITEFEKGYDIVSGKRVNREDKFSRRLTSQFANKIMAHVAKHKLTDFGCTFKIYNGKLVRAFGFGPYKRWKTSFVFSRAGKVIEVPVNHHPRKYGESGQSFRGLVNFLFDNIIGLSDRPFLLLSMGSAILVLLFILRILIAFIFDFTVVKVVSPGLLLNFIVLQILMLLMVAAALGEYIFRSYLRIEGDPIYVVRDKLTRTVK